MFCSQVSWATGGCEPFDERLLTPIMRSKSWKRSVGLELKTKDIIYKSVQGDEKN
jgi:hypothetical protein